MRLLGVIVLAACSAPSRPTTAPASPPAPPPSAAVAPPAAIARPAPLAYLDGTLATLAAKYIDPDRLDVRRMLRGALDALERDIPEVIAESAPDHVTVRVNHQRRRFAADVGSLAELGPRLGEIVRFVQAHANAGTRPDEIELGAVNGMLRTLDPHTFIISAKELADWNVNLGGKFGGVGLVIGMHDQRITVEQVIANAPAARGGIAVGDTLAAINGHATEALTLDEALERLRGEPGSAIELVIERGAALLVVPLTRAEIHVPAVEARLLPGKVGYVALDQFAPDSASQLERAMTQLRTRGARAWVLDLRENGGGYLSQAVQSADLFVETGTIVATVAGGTKHDVRQARSGGVDTQNPVVVMVSERTASSAEVLAGALKQLDRAVIVGRRTFGKGSIQVLEDAAHGAKLKITTAAYVAANDVSPQGSGVVPDVELVPAHVPAQITEHDRLRLVPAAPPRELDLGAHLATAQRPDADEPLASIRYVASPDPAADFEVGFARDVALAMKTRTRRDGLKRLPRVIERANARAERGLGSALRRLGLDWTRGAPGTKLAVKFDDRVTTATGAVVTLRGEVTNLGPTPAFRVHARALSDDPALDGLEMAFGAIPPRATKRATAIVRLPIEPTATTASLTWQLETGEQATTQLAIAPTAVPDFALAATLADDGDGVANANEPLRVRARVTNRGPGRAARAVATLKSLVGERVLVERGRVTLGAVAPNETKDVELVFAAAPGVAGRIALELAVTDGPPTTTRAHRLEVALGTRVASQRWELTPPAVRIDDVPLETTAERVRISGVASDERIVSDVYVTVSNAGAHGDARKVFYAAGTQRRLAFSADVPLTTGLNRITVTAREHATSQTVGTRWVVKR